MVAKVGVSLIRQLVKQLRNIKEEEEKIESAVDRGITSPQRTEAIYYKALLNKLRGKFQKELPLGSGSIAFKDLPKTEQDRLRTGGFAKSEGMLTIPSVEEQGLSAKKILGQRIKALEEQEARDLSEIVKSPFDPAKKDKEMPVFERAARYDYESYDAQTGPTRRDAFKDRYTVRNPYAPNYEVGRDDPPGTQFIANQLRRTDPKTGKTTILSPREARLENLKIQREEVEQPDWTPNKDKAKELNTLKRKFEYLNNVREKKVNNPKDAKLRLERREEKPIEEIYSEVENKLNELRGKHSKSAQTKLNLIDRQINYHELTIEKNKISSQLRNETNPTKKEGLQEQLNNINNELKSKPDKPSLGDKIKLTEGQQFSEDKQISKVLEYLTLSKKLSSPKALSSAEPLAKQSDPIIVEDGLTIGKFTKQGKEKFNLERAGTGASDAEKQLAIVTSLIERARGTNKPTGRIGEFAPRDYTYEDTSKTVENIFEGIGRVRRENNYINQLLVDQEKAKGRPLMPDEIEEQFPRIYNEYIKPVAKELEQEEQLKKQLRESAGGTGEAIGEEAGYIPSQVSAFMRGQKDIPSTDARPEKIDLDEIYEGKQFEIDPDPELEGMPQRRSTDEFTERLYDDTAATTKLNPEQELISKETRIEREVENKLKGLRKDLEKIYGRTTSAEVTIERKIDERRKDLLERGLAGIQPKKDVRGAAEKFFKKPKKQSKKKPASKKLTPAEKNKRIKSVNKKIKELTPLIEKNGPEKYKKRIDSINKDIVELGIERKALKGSKKKIKTLQEEIKELNKKNVRRNPFKEKTKIKKQNSIKKEIKKLKSYNDPPRYKGEFGSDRHPVFKRKGGSLRGQGAALRGF